MRPTILTICFLLVASAVARAADAPLYQQEPYDTIKLDEANRNAELKVRPLDLPDRRVPAKPNPGDELEIHLLDRPRKAYKVAWENIVEIKLFEQRVLEEAELLVQTRMLDEAYPFYDFLQRRYPKLPGLGESYNKFLMAGAIDAFKKEKYEECLALSWELYARDPEYKGASTAILRAADKLIDGRFVAGDFAAARTLLQEATDRLKERAAPLATTWNDKLHAKAVALITAASDKLHAKRYSDASQAVRQALAAWPEVESGKELADAIQAQYPEVVVGVTALSLPGSATTCSWEARRDGRLLARSIVEIAQISDIGVVYAHPLAKLSRASEDRRVTLAVNPQVHWSDGRQPLTGADLARALLGQGDLGHPFYRPQWRELVTSLSVVDVEQVRIDFKQSLGHVEPWLETPVWPEYASPGHGLTSLSLGPYRIESSDGKETRFAAVDGYFAAGAKQPKQIVERLYPDAASALRALRRGEIDVVDRIGPWDAAALASSESFAVEPYGPSSLHVLVPNVRRPLMSDPTFRRALAHAVDRSGILIDQLSRGKLPPGCELVDGLFRRPASRGPRGTETAAAGLRYDPGVAKLLGRFSLADSVVKSQTSGDKPVIPAELVLAYPADEVARLACQAISRQVQAAGVSLRLKEVSVSELTSGASDADLIYVEWTPLEPPAELPCLIGRRGLGGDAGPRPERLMRDAIVAAPDQAAARTSQLEEAIADQSLAIPLWRLNNYVAYDRGLMGVGRRPVTLYQNVEQWKLSVASPHE